MLLANSVFLIPKFTAALPAATLALRSPCIAQSNRFLGGGTGKGMFNKILTDIHRGSARDFEVLVQVLKWQRQAFNTAEEQSTRWQCGMLAQFDYGRAGGCNRVGEAIGSRRTIGAWTLPFFCAAPKLA